MGRSGCCTASAQRCQLLLGCSRIADVRAGPDQLLAWGRRALAALAGHLRAWGLAGAQLTLDPLLRPHQGFSGIAYQVHLVAAATGASQLVAVGAPSSCWPAATTLQSLAHGQRPATR